MCAVGRGVLVLGAAVVLPGCEVALFGAAAGGAMTAFEDRRSPGTQIDDEAIELRISNRVAERFGDKVHLNVNAYNRFALLTGEAPDEAARQEIEKIALAVPNVRGVSNDVQAGLPSSMASRAGDSFTTSKVKARLLDAAKVNPVHVKVATEAGVVYLMGVVTEKEADEAVQVARTTGGVRKVVKIFEYCQPTDEVCRPRARAGGDAAKTKPGS
ncbi:MAG: BON domain-containing protein [Betaproteobacteria bacterium]|nr:BON domain-containing protein [Betaproteobacteria bacterium]